MIAIAVMSVACLFMLIAALAPLWRDLDAAGCDPEEVRDGDK